MEKQFPVLQPTRRRGGLPECGPEEEIALGAIADLDDRIDLVSRTERAFKVATVERAAARLRAQGLKADADPGRTGDSEKGNDNPVK